MSNTNYKTYDLVGMAEDVADVITDISPTYTPVYSSLNKEACHNPLYQWQTDELDPLDTTALVEGADATDANHTPTVMLQNYTQIFGRVVKVSGSAQAIKAYGRGNELAREIEKKAKSMKRSFEKAAVGGVTAPVAGSDSVARVTGSILHFINEDASTIVDGLDTLNEDSVMEMLKLAYTQGGEPSKLVYHEDHALAIADWATAAGRQRDFAQDKTVTRAVDIVVTPYGTLSCDLDRFISTDHIFGFDPMFASIKQLRSMVVDELAKTGDSDKFQMITEFGFKVDNPKAHGFVYNLS